MKGTVDPDDRFSIAVEHCVWAATNGFSPHDVILAVHQAMPVKPEWSDAVYALVYAQIAQERANQFLARRPKIAA